MGSPKPVRRQPFQEPYVRTRENSFFNGLLRGDDQGNTSSQKISQSTSDIGKTRQKYVPDISEKCMGSSLEESMSPDIILEPIGRSSSGRWFKDAKPTSSAVTSTRSDFAFDVEDQHDSVNQSISSTLDTNEVYEALPTLSRPIIEKTYTVSKSKGILSSIPLPQSAASFYNGFSPELVITEVCESTSRLDLYLKAGKAEINAGVPGRFLHAVMGQDVSGVGSVASTIMYAFYLHETQKTDEFCTVPVINMQRDDLSSNAELNWLLESCQIDPTSLIFIDEIDLSYYDLFGSLKLVLLNSHKLPTKQEALKEAVVEILNCKKGESGYPWVQNVTPGEDCSCCTLIAEKFALTSPELLVGQGLSRLLLAGILMDTGNLSNYSCSSQDKYMATLLIHGAGRFGCNGLYQILRYKMYDVSELKVVDILRKDFKRWTRVGIGKQESAGARMFVSHIGMSSIGISVADLLAHEDTATQEIKYFQQFEKLRLLMIVSGYYDSQKNFKREILVSAESVERMKNLLFFLNSNATQLPLKVIHRPGLREEMRAFEIDKLTSRKTIERLLEEFGGTPRS
ncbi:uncharacterized protein LOC107418662 isoform X1 [Ziziphus jujuba]|uniref:Uncharacterized protein LOC107418662 isoform X1 n=1 Tax=Ziziphus jujuba TaxID=326968 RepID=A0A6P3ZSM2_ZIZJJ|nr:uncharacterized protein LOC107418662 isoform X1 [Ziziphus jujuba]